MASQIKWALGGALAWEIGSWLIQQAALPKEHSIEKRMRAIAEKKIHFPQKFQTEKKRLSLESHRAVIFKDIKR
jgi:hypothetical protein